MGYFVSSPRGREKRDRRDSRGDEREGQGRKRNRNESEETDEIKTFPQYPYLCPCMKAVTLKAPSMIATDIFFFRENKQMIHMKCQDFFSLEKKIRMLSATNFAWRFKVCTGILQTCTCFDTHKNIHKTCRIIRILEK